MILLAVVGAVALAAALIYTTLGWLAPFFFSDETYWFGWKYHFKENLIYHSFGLILAVFWWFYITFFIHHVHISFSLT